MQSRNNLVWKNHSEKFNQNLRLSITNKCNLSCFFCHKEGVPEQSNTVLSLAMYEALFKAANKEKILKIRIVGGEPLLNKDWGEIVKIAKNHIDDVGITSNGYTLTENDINFLNKNNINVNISIPAIEENLFRSITGGVNVNKILSSLNLLSRVKANVILLKDNIDYFLDILNSIKQDIKILECRHPKSQHVGLKEFHQLMIKNGFKYDCNLFDAIMYYKNSQKIYWLKKKYSSQLCTNCDYYPCGEGFSYMRVYYNGTMSRCIYGHKKRNSNPKYESIDYWRHQLSKFRF